MTGVRGSFEGCLVQAAYSMCHVLQSAALTANQQMPAG